MRKDADLIVVLAHTGLDGPSAYDTTGVGREQMAARLAAGVTRPDVVVVGHSHAELVDTVIGGVHFVQPRPEGRGLAVVHIALLPKGRSLEPVRIRAERIVLDDVPPAPRVLRRLADPHRAVLGWVATVLGESGGRLSLAAARVEDAPLMRFVNGVQRRAAKADLAVAPVFDLRAGFDEGEITVGQLLRVYPAENTLRAIRVNGAQLRAYLEQCARYFYADSSGLVATNRFVPPTSYDLLAGAQYTIDLGKPMGSRVTRLEVRGRAVAPTDSFTLALASTRQLGAGSFAMLAGAPVVYDRGEYVRDLLAAEIRRRHTLRPEDLAGTDWSLAPPEMARRARALFVRDVAAAPPPEPVAPSSVGLPLQPSARERARQDSILRAQDKAEAAASVTVATLRLPAEPGADHGLGRLLADAYRNSLRADVAVVHGDEVGALLPAGGVTAGQIAAAAPGDHHLLTLKLTGQELEQVLEHVVEADGPCCELSGLRVEFNPRAKPLQRVGRVRLPDGASLEGKRVYVLALSQRLIDGDSVFILGGTDCRAGKGCRKEGRLDRWAVQRSEHTPADVVGEYLRRLPQPVTPPSDPRLLPSR
jgi:2',3'-cyclic-nucleotide 2'-phosphodiesterase (5'-nucleotidase family)